MRLVTMRLRLTVAILLTGMLLLCRVPRAMCASSDCYHPGDAAEQAALLEFKAGLDASSAAQLNLSPSTDPCCVTWTGVACDISSHIGHVREL